MTETLNLGSNVLYECPVILNPKNPFQLKANAQFAIREDGVWFDASPPGLIPYSTIHQAKSGVISGITIEHGDIKTIFMPAELSAPMQVVQIANMINQIRQKGFEGQDATRLKNEVAGLRNYWALFIVVVALGSSGGAIGGASGFFAGYWAQKIINKRPSRSVWAKAGIVIAAILLGFIIYTILAMIVVLVFPGLAPKQPSTYFRK